MNSNQNTWDIEKALAKPEAFIGEYIDRNRRRRSNREDSEVERSLEEIYDIVLDLVLMSDFSSVLEMLQMGLAKCAASDRDLSDFAAGPVENFIMVRVKTPEETELLRAAIEEDRVLRSTLERRLVWINRESLDNHVAAMLADYAPARL